MDIENFYSDLLNFSPYKYQVKAAELLLSGENVILSVPTGAGKTWASIIPFLYAIQKNISSFPQKLIYSLPLRTLTNSIYSDVINVLTKKSEFNKLASIHTGEYKNDENFESDIIFSTIDQTLSNFLSIPLSKSRRQANINAGALIGSYLVFDEFHLLDIKLSMATTLGTLKILKDLSRFCIMTATLSNEYIEKLKTALDATVIHIDDFPEDAKIISSLKIPKDKKSKKEINVISHVISAKDIKNKHKNKTIVICNRVEKVQKLYNELRSFSELDKTKIICLHARFFSQHRKEKEALLKELFGKRNKTNAILISTQVIEAGMDISCETMHIDISPVNSLLQRAGRCARWEGEYGEIYVYDILDKSERELLKTKEPNGDIKRQIKIIKNKFLPYNQELCESTFKEIKNIKFINEGISQNLVNIILSAKENDDFDKIRQKDEGFNRRLIKQSWEDCEKNIYSTTIRDINNLDIVIIDHKKEKEGIFYPYKYETISLYRWTFIKWAKEIQENKDDEDDFIFIAVNNKDSAFIDSFASENEGFQLKQISSIDELKNYYDIIFIDKSALKYTKETGLELGIGSQHSPIKELSKEDAESISFKKDTFLEHNKAIENCYKEYFKPKFEFVFGQLNILWNENIDWDRLITIMIYFHDYGKLNNNWQQPMQLLQKLKSKKGTSFSFIKDEILAHCDFNPETDFDIEQKSNVRQKPPHAGIGALALIEVIYEYSEDVIGNLNNKDNAEFIGNCIATAILKHHGVDTISYPDFEIPERNYQEMERLLKILSLDMELITKERGGNYSNDYLPEDTREWLTYLFFVRILRLCDQKATKDISKYLN